MSIEPAKKRRGPGKPFTKNDPRRGRGGRRPNEASPTYWLKHFGGMTGAQVADAADTFVREFRKYGDKIPVAAVYALRLWLSQLYEPDGRLSAIVFNRIDGTQTQTLKIEDELVTWLRSVSDRLRAEPEYRAWVARVLAEGGQDARGLFASVGVNADYAEPDAVSD